MKISNIDLWTITTSSCRSVLDFKNCKFILIVNNFIFIKFNLVIVTSLLLEVFLLLLLSLYVFNPKSQLLCTFWPNFYSETLSYGVILLLLFRYWKGWKRYRDFELSGSVCKQWAMEFSKPRCCLGSCCYISGHASSHGTRFSQVGILEIRFRHYVLHYFIILIKLLIEKFLFRTIFSYDNIYPTTHCIVQMRYINIIQL